MFSIKNNDKYELIIKNSKFISLIFRVYSKDEVIPSIEDSDHGIIEESPCSPNT